LPRDALTGEQIDVTDGNVLDVQGALARGDADIGEDEVVFVRDADGGLVELKGSDQEHVAFLQSVVAGQAEGFRLATQAERVHGERLDQYQDSPVTAGMIGAMRGLTLGATDALASDADQEMFRLIEEANPGATMVGEVVGAAAPALLTGGGSAAATGGARVAGGALALTPAGLAARAGLATEQAVSRVAARTLGEGLAARVTARATSLAAGGAVEGAIFGAGDALSESALQGTDLTAESILAHASDGALFGGAAGAVLGGTLGVAEGGFSRLRGLVSSGDGVVSREARTAAQDLVEAGTGVRLPDGVADDLVRASDPDAVFRGRTIDALSRVTGLGDEAAETARRIATDESFARLATRADEVLEEATPRLRQGFDELQSMTDSLDDIIRARAKREMFEVIQSPLSVEGRQAGAQLLDGVEALAQELDQSQTIIGSKGMAKRLRGIADEIGAPVRMPTEGIAEDISASLTRQGAIDQAVALDSMKRHLQREVKRAKDPSLREALKDLQEKFRTHLEDESIYGAGATAQQEINRKLSEWIANDGVFSGLFQSKTGRRSTVDPWVDHMAFDASKTRRWLKQTGTADGRILDDVIDQQIAGLEDVFSTIAKHYDLPDDVLEKLARLPDVTRSLRGTVDEVRQTAGARNAWQALQDASGPRLLEKMVGGGGGVAASVAGGPLAALAVGAVSARGALRSQIPEIAKTLGGGGGMIPPALLRGSVARVVMEGRLGTAAKRFVRGAPSGARAARIARTTTTAALLSTRRGRDVFRERVQAIVDADDEQIPNLSAQMGAGFEDDAPNVASAAAQKMAAAVGYLRSTLPATAMPDPNVPGDRAGLAAPQEMAGWLRRVSAAEAPLEAAERAAAGVASPEEIETIRSVYPEVYGMLTRTVEAELALAQAEGVEIPWRRRQQMHAALGVRADRATGATLTLQTQLGVQASPLAQPPAGQGGSPGTPPPRPLPSRGGEDDAPSSAFGTGD
jgi:hypothetical protein